VHDGRYYQEVITQMTGVQSGPPDRKSLKWSPP
jgi:hypothetical protein